VCLDALLGGEPVSLTAFKHSTYNALGASTAPHIRFERNNSSYCHLGLPTKPGGG